MCPLGPHLGVVAHPPQQPVRHPRRAPRSPRDLDRRVGIDRHADDPRRPRHDLAEVVFAVEIQPVHDAEPRAERRGQQAGPGRGADEREPLHRHLHRSGARPLADHDVELVVFHRRIENLLDRRAHPVHFVDEQHLARLEVREDAGEVPGLLDHRAGGRPDRHLELVRNHARQRGLPQSRRAVEQHVIERLVPLFRGLDRHAQVLADPLLADVLVERTRPQPGFVLGVLVPLRGGQDAIVGHAGVCHRPFMSDLRTSFNACSKPVCVEPSSVRSIAGSATPR